MNRIIQGFKRGVTSDLRLQFAHPTRSIIGELATRYWENQNKPLVDRVISKFELTPDSRVLDFGFGRGYGIEVCHSIINKGSGMVFGIESSSFMHQRGLARFSLEITEENSITLDTLSLLNNLPYPTNFLDAAYHIDVFYFLTPKEIRELCKDLFRIMKPGARVLCAMELNRLRRMANYGILDEKKFDPMYYMVHLGPAGFKDIKIEYEKISPNREIQLISATKPINIEDELEPEENMKKLEMEIKKFMAMQSLMKAEQPNVEEFRKYAKQKDDAKEANK